MLEIARTKLPRVQLDEVDIEKGLPYEDNYFDKVVSSLVFQFIKDPKISFREMCRVLKQGGIAFITTFVSDASLSWDDIEYGEQYKAKRKSSSIPAGSVQRVSTFRALKDYVSLAEESGFSSVSCEPLIVNQQVKGVVTEESWEKIEGKWASVILVLKK